MKILFLVSDTWEGTGGISKFNLDFLASLQSLTPSPQISRLSLAYGRWPFLWNLWRLTKNNSFDIVVCGHIHLAPAVKFLCSKIPKKYLIIHGFEAWKKNRHFWVNRCLNQFDHLISVSQVTQQRFLNWATLTATKLHILPNCVDLNKFIPMHINPELVKKYGTENKTVLMTLSRLETRDRYKGIDEVLELLPALSKKIPQIRYLVVGDGSDKIRLEQKAQFLHIRHLVEFTGFIPESEKLEIYQLADVFLMPGYGEGFGIVYLEAMACGIPVIASTLDGSREAVLEGKLGQMVNPHKPEEIKKAILTALQQPKGQRPEGLDYFSFENYQKRVHQIFQ